MRQLYTNNEPVYLNQYFQNEGGYGGGFGGGEPVNANPLPVNVKKTVPISNDLTINKKSLLIVRKIYMLIITYPKQKSPLQIP